MTELPNDIESLKALIVQLLEKIAQLEAENAELRRRLGMDSHNSDKPPSSDGYQKNIPPSSLMVGKMPCNLYTRNRFIGRHFAHPTWL